MKKFNRTLWVSLFILSAAKCLYLELRRPNLLVSQMVAEVIVLGAICCGGFAVTQYVIGRRLGDRSEPRRLAASGKEIRLSSWYAYLATFVLIVNMFPVFTKTNYRVGDSILNGIDPRLLIFSTVIAVVVGAAITKRYKRRAAQRMADKKIGGGHDPYDQG